MNQGILFDILAKRLETMARIGAEFGHPVPASRQVPLVPFLRPPAVICEIKKRSPSRGIIDAELDPVSQAKLYVEAGVRTVSVLTEEERFGGSLLDLMAVKNAFPQLSVLRKDFLATEEDILVSYRAGADAVLLIAGLLDEKTLEARYYQARKLGMAVLLEVHNRDDVLKAQRLCPRFTGINCRDLASFRLDPTLPLRIRPLIQWNTQVIYESGIFEPYQAQWTALGQFHGVLVGEGAVRDKTLAPKLVQTYQPWPRPSFWARLYSPKVNPGPLVKICGITSESDLAIVERAGADMAGFILAPSPRQVSPNFIRNLGGSSVIKVGVVVLEANQEIPPEIKELLEEGSLDALQFHGQETPEFIKRHAHLGYKALRPQSAQECVPWKEIWPPRFLVDAFVPHQPGGTGKQVSPEILKALHDQPLWLAGGLGVDNVADVIREWRPELVDASSKLEKEPGIKDHDKILRFVEEVRIAFP